MIVEKSANTEIKMTARATELFHAIKRCDWRSTPAKQENNENGNVNNRRSIKCVQKKRYYFMSKSSIYEQ